MAAQKSENALILPGQTKPASQLLVSTIGKVQEQVGKPIAVRDITQHPIREKTTNRGTYSWTDNEVEIWLSPKLSFDDQEAVVAHELAHVMQRNDGYWVIEALVNREGQYLLPELAELAGNVMSLVTDVPADAWAAHRGFKVEEGLKKDLFPKALESAKNLRQWYVEAVNWNNYYAYLNDVVRALASKVQVPARLPQEVRTQISAVIYATFKLRLSPFHLFTEVDTAFGRDYPGTRSLGIAVANLVESIGMADKGQCNRATVEVLKFLNIPPQLTSVRNLVTNELIWPKQVSP